MKERQSEIGTTLSDGGQNQVRVFENAQFGQIRTAQGASGEPLFCLADVCKALGLSNPRKVKTQLSQKGVTISDTPTKGGMQQLNFITEANLYRCIFQSRKEEAELFQDWVCEEVLPAIRQTGGYVATQADDTPELIMARALQVAQSTIERHTKQLEAAKATITSQSEQLKAQAPKVAFANAIITSNTSCLIGELAKLICQNGVNIGQNRLFEWMRKNGYIGKRGENRNIPNQQYIEQGLFELKKGVRSGNDGGMYHTITPKVTGKGQAYFINKFLYNNAQEQKGGAL